MAVAISRPDFDRHDDVRSLRFRIRRLTFSGNYEDDQSTTQVEAADLGLKQIMAVVPCTNGLVDSDTAPTVMTPVHPMIASDRKSVGFFVSEAAAAGSPLAEKTDAEAFAATVADFIFIGY